MKTQGKVWLFYDADSKVQSRPMSVIQAQVFILSLKPHDYPKYFLWTPGWDEWTCIREFVNSKQTYFVLSQPPKPDGDVTALIEDVPAPPEDKIGRAHV